MGGGGGGGGGGRRERERKRETIEERGHQDKNAGILGTSWGLLPKNFLRTSSFGHKETTRIEPAVTHRLPMQSRDQRCGYRFDPSLHWWFLSAHLPSDGQSSSGPRSKVPKARTQPHYSATAEQPVWIDKLTLTKRSNHLRKSQEIFFLGAYTNNNDDDDTYPTTMK